MAITSSTLLAVGAITAAVGAVGSATVGTMSAIQQHKQAKANAEMQEQEALRNAKVEQNAAAATEAQMQENARRQQEYNSYERGAQYAAFGKAGVGMASGSPLALLGATAAEEQRKVNDSMMTGYSQAQQHVNAATNLKYQAGVARASKPSKATQGWQIAGQGIKMIGDLGQIGMNYGMTRGSVN